MVCIGIPFQQQLGDGDDSKTPFLQDGQESSDRLRGIFSGIMKKNNRSVLDPTKDPLKHGPAVVLPVYESTSQMIVV